MSAGLRAGYKQTEVGVIPKAWDVADLQKVCAEKITYGIVQCGPHVENGVPYIRVSDMNSPVLDVSGMLRTSQVIASQFSRSQVKEGDVVYALRGKIGEVRNVDQSVAGANLTQGTARLSPSSRMDSTYLLYCLRSQVALRQGDLAAKGSTFREITLESLRQIQLAIAPLPEQRAIAAALSDVDALLAKLDEFIAKKRDLKQAAMQQLLTGQTRLPGFSGEWDVNTIEELEKLGIVKLSRGKVISKKDIEKSPGECPIYSSSVKNDGLFGRYGKNMFDEELITWSVDGGGHFFHRAKHKFSVTNVCGYMRLDTARINYRFFAAQLQLLHGKLKFDYQDKAHPSVIRKAYSVAVPSMDEQLALSLVSSDMDTELATLEARRDKTRALKQGMMQELLTGRIRLV